MEVGSLPVNQERDEMLEKKSVVEVFDTQASDTPQAIAVVFEDQHLTYNELNVKANELAYSLRALGIGPETLVALCTERSVDLIVGVIGILKSGAAYVPLDPLFPEERLSMILDETKAKAVLTQRHLASLFPSSMINTIYLDGDEKSVNKHRRENPPNRAKPENLVYVMFTSGSTGKPKGVAIEHRQLLNYVNAILNRLSISSPSRFATVSSYATDLGNTAIFPALCSGGSVYLISRERASDAKALADYFRINPVDYLKIVPSHLSALLVSQNPHILPKKGLILGGEVCYWDLIERIKTLNPDCTIFNHYGPTETTVGVTTYRIKNSDNNLTSSTVPIGKPLSNTHVYLLDAKMQPVPDGEIGEIYIGGAGVARGYLNRSDQTDRKFVKNPFVDDQQTRLYRTGDNARQLKDGSLEFLGRTDFQVKIRGFRVELEEIESALRQISWIREATVIVWEDKTVDKRLVAYAVLEGKSEVKTDRIRKALSRTLPDYMIPTSFVFLDALPLNASGKIDRKALPIPELDRSTLASDFVAPRNATEETLANIWAQVIGLDRIGINDNFFELGGDSILGIQITSKANQIGLTLTPDQIFNFPTIAQLADVAGTAPIIQAEQGVIAGPLPLTPIQHWYFEQNLLEPHHWNQAFLLRAPQTLDFSLLEKAFYQLLIHHDALRLCFTLKNSVWHQVMTSPDEVVPVSRLNLSGLTKVEQKTAIQSNATELQASLNLSEGPLMRVALFELDSHEPSYLLIIIHHLAVDGVSWRILLEHLEVLYNQLSHNKVVQLPPKTTSYKHWANQLEEYAQSDELQQELPFWLAMQENQQPSLPVDYPLGINDNTVSSIDIIPVSLNVEKTEMLLKQVPKAYQTEINDVLLTALAQAVTRWTGTSTLLIDLEGHGREAIFEDVELSRTVGWFTTIFPVSLNLEKTSNIGEMLKSVKEQLRCIPNRGIGYGILRYLRKDTKTLQALPQAELNFNYLGQFDQMLSPTSPFELTNEDYGPRRSLRGKRRYLLEITGSIVEGKLQLSWVYSKNIHRQTTIELLAKGFMDALENLIDHCQSLKAGGFTPSDFPEADLSQEELDDLMSEISEL
jgi:amino acid adenylation domain-containing protein/non-ribosomal peptide synthase protein (TIGR01720 family)